MCSALLDFGASATVRDEVMYSLCYFCVVCFFISFSMQQCDHHLQRLTTNCLPLPRADYTSPSLRARIQQIYSTTSYLFTLMSWYLHLLFEGLRFYNSRVWACAERNGARVLPARSPCRTHIACAPRLRRQVFSHAPVLQSTQTLLSLPVFDSFDCVCAARIQPSGCCACRWHRGRALTAVSFKHCAH